MVLATEIMIPPRRNSFNSPPESPSKSPPKSNWWFFTSKLKPSTSYGGSSQTVAIQKLRESKWFNQDEERLFCAVIESGFIVEIMQNEQSLNENKSHYGVVSVEAKKSELLSNKTQTKKCLFSYHLSVSPIIHNLIRYTTLACTMNCLCVACVRNAVDVSSCCFFSVSSSLVLLIERKQENRIILKLLSSSRAAHFCHGSFAQRKLIIYFPSIFGVSRQEAHSQRYFRLHGEQI